jgi:hypothetical protein
MSYCNNAKVAISYNPMKVECRPVPVGIRLLLRSVFTYVPAELPLNLATAHGAGCKAWCVIGKPKSKRRCSCSRDVGRLGVL